jgi:hypothetical protein
VSATMIASSCLVTTRFERINNNAYTSVRFWNGIEGYYKACNGMNQMLRYRKYNVWASYCQSIERRAAHALLESHSRDENISHCSERMLSVTSLHLL